MTDNSGYSDSPFKSRTLFWLIALGILATLGIAVTSVIQGDGRYETSPGNNSFSKSALGHAAFAALMQEQGWTVLQSQHNTEAKLAQDGIALLVIEPRGSVGTGRIEELTDYVPTLIVLPKRQGVAGGGRAGWIGAQRLLRTNAPQTIVDSLTEGMEVTRPAAKPDAWTGDFGGLGDPDIDDVQLLSGTTLSPIIQTDKGILFGRLTADHGSPVWVLSDPDLLATHGLARGWNAELANAVIDTVAAGGETLVIDEIVHGFTMEPSLVRAMFRAPFVYATVPALVALLVFLAALTRRFGAPRRRASTVRDSKAVFIDNSARLLQLADKEHEALLRLVDDSALEVARRLNIPADIEKNRLEAWLDEKSRLRGVNPDFTTIKRRVQRIRGDDDLETRHQRILILANQFRQWKHEILHEHK